LWWQDGNGQRRVDEGGHWEMTAEITDGVTEGQIVVALNGHSIRRIEG
jgi:hypothetical protein